LRIGEYKLHMCNLKRAERVIIGVVGLALPGELWIGNISGGDVVLGESFGKGHLLRNRLGFAMQSAGQKRQTVGGDILEGALSQFLENTILECSKLRGARAISGADCLMGEFVLDGRFVCQAVGELSTPDNESARRDVESGGDFGVGNAARALGDELFDNFGIFSVHKSSEFGW